MYSISKFLKAANQSAAAVNRKVIEITQTNLNWGFDLAKSLVGAARSPSEIVRLQTSYWRKQFDELSTQAEEARNRLFGFSAAKSKTPLPPPKSTLEEPSTKSSARLQKENDRAAQDFATARPGQKPRAKTSPLTARTARSSFSLRVKTQPGIQKSGTPTRKPKRIQKSPVRDPVDEGARPQAGKTAANELPSSAVAPRSRPTGISFGMLDGNAVRFTNLEAWWLVDGTWRPISPDEVLSNAAVMREARFKKLFPNVPLLPKKAFQSHHR